MRILGMYFNVKDKQNETCTSWQKCTVLAPIFILLALVVTVAQVKTYYANI